METIALSAITTSTALTTSGTVMRQRRLSASPAQKDAASAASAQTMPIPQDHFSNTSDNAGIGAFISAANGPASRA